MRFLNCLLLAALAGWTIAAGPTTNHGDDAVRLVDFERLAGDFQFFCTGDFESGGPDRAGPLADHGAASD
jgi:hypothetical protein